MCLRRRWLACLGEEQTTFREATVCPGEQWLACFSHEAEVVAPGGRKLFFLSLAMWSERSRSQKTKPGSGNSLQSRESPAQKVYLQLLIEVVIHGNMELGVGEGGMVFGRRFVVEVDLNKNSAGCKKDTLLEANVLSWGGRIVFVGWEGGREGGREGGPGHWWSGQDARDGGGLEFFGDFNEVEGR
ncbi:hypothetical protein L208DRAFT_1379182 [Tricholoma matsutake]|nr:hypothetical protein L208DRAFT_1379182 [Tricholoma matsutake 945]